VPWRRTLLDKTSRRLWRTAFTVGCSPIAADTSSKARYLLWAEPPLCSGMCIRLAPLELFFHIETLSQRLEGRPWSVCSDLVCLTCRTGYQAAGHGDRMRATFSGREQGFEVVCR
jgi:hypothetical protein